MRVEKIHVDGFGIFNDLGIDNIPAGISVFYGENEAGKTTLLAFLRYVLFGFPDGRSSENPYLPLSGGVYGGRIVLVGQGAEKYVVERRPGTYGGKSTVTLPSGDTGDSAVLQRLLGFASRDLYRNVFAFSLHELQHFESLDNEAVTSAIYSAGAGTGLLSLPDVAKGLEKSMGELFKPGGTKPEINRILRELETCRKKIRENSDRVDDYDQVQRDLTDIEKSIEELQSSKEIRQRERDRAKALLQAWEDWVSLKACEKERFSLPEVCPLPPDAVSRLDGFERKLEDVDSEIRRCDSEVRALEKERDVLIINDALLRQEHEIQQLQRGRDHYDKVKTELPLREQEFETATDRVTEALRDIGTDWDLGKLKAFDTSIPARELIRTYRTDLEDADNLRTLSRAALENERRRVDEATQAETHCRKVLSTLERPKEKNAEALENRYRDAKRLFFLTRNQGGLHEKVGHLEDRKRDIASQMQRTRERIERATFKLRWWPAFLHSTSCI